MTRHVLAIALATIVTSWTVVSAAEPPLEEDESTDAARTHPGRSRGINPVADATPTAPPPKAGTTTTTAATLMPAMGERPEDRDLVRPHRSMLITGSALFLGAYGVTAAGAALSDTDADKRLYIPLVGPWLDLGDRECGFGQCGFREDVNILHIIGSGAAQATGLVLAVASFFVEERRGGRPAPQRPAPEPPRTTFHVVPHFGGIGAVGTF